MEQRQNPYADVLNEIENGLWEHDLRVEEGIAAPYSYTHESFRACLKIFMSGMMWKLWENMEGTAVQKKAGKAEEMGNEMRNFILKYTGIDTHELYNIGGQPC